MQLSQDDNGNYGAITLDQKIVIFRSYGEFRSAYNANCLEYDSKPKIEGIGQQCTFITYTWE